MSVCPSFRLFTCLSFFLYFSICLFIICQFLKFSPMDCLSLFFPPIHIYIKPHQKHCFPYNTGVQSCGSGGILPGSDLIIEKRPDPYQTWRENRIRIRLSRIRKNRILNPIWIRLQRKKPDSETDPDLQPRAGVSWSNFSINVSIYAP